MSFLQHLKDATNVAYTLNADVVYETSNSAVLDMFAQGGATRNWAEVNIQKLVSKAAAEDLNLTILVLFYLGDIRGGQGERRFFRMGLRYLANNYTETLEKVIDLIPTYNRWDTMYTFMGTKLESDVLTLMREQFTNDLEATDNNVSLIGKWLASENASSPETKRLGTLTRKAFGLSAKEYRKALTKLRRKIDIVETKLTQGEYEAIDYSKLPSVAGRKYLKAFLRNDNDRFTNFLERVEKGEATVNVKDLYPYEIIRDISSHPSQDEIRAAEVAWNNLPNYCGKGEHNVLCMADVSGSMFGYGNSVAPIHISISLAMYFGERLKGPFKNHFLTFSRSPKLQQITGKTIYDKYHNLSRADWDMNTNVRLAFELILNTAVKNSTPVEEMPQMILIISDMQFDYGTEGVVLQDELKKKFEEAGYKLPTLVYWNVEAYGSQSPVTKHESGAILLSGASPSTINALLSGDLKDPYSFMLKVIDVPRYAPIAEKLGMV